MKIRLETIALAFATLLMLGIGARHLASGDSPTAVGALQAPITGSAYTSTAIPSIEASPRNWEHPPSQSAGANWIFEVFTPPIIYYNPQTAAFTLTPPGTVKLLDKPFSVRLLKVTRPLFRFQYRGHLGEGSRTVIQIEDTLQQRWLDLRIGETQPEVGLRVISFETTRELREDAANNNAPLLFEDVRLNIELLPSGERFTLTRQPLYTDQEVATLIDAEGRQFSLLEGASITDGDSQLILESIQATPPQVILRRPPSDKLPERRETLLPQ